MENNKKSIVAGQWIVKGLNSSINLVMLSACLILLLFGSFVLFLSDSVYRQADASAYNMYKPVAGEVDGGPSFSELQNINPDISAWLTVYGTHIDYPVAHADNNDKYINTDALGEYSLSGSLFLDYNNAPGFTDFSNIIYGHHMEKNKMFGELASFLDQEYFNAREYGELFYEGKNHGIRFFAALEADAYDDTIYRTDVPAGEEEAYVSHLIAVSKNSRKVEIKPNERLVLLSTCTTGSSSERHILAGVITADTYGDPFAAGETGGASTNKHQVDHRKSGLLGGIDWQLLVSPIILVLLIVLYWLCGRVRRGRYENNE